MMKGKLIGICTAIMAVMLSATAALGQEATVPLVGACINESYVQFGTGIIIGGIPSDVTLEPIYCPQGCIDNSGQYGADCAVKPITGMMLEIFLSISLMGLGSLALGIWKKKWLPCMFSTIIFLMLSFQGLGGVVVMFNGEIRIYQDIILVYLLWFGAMVSTIYSFVGFINQKREMMEGDLKEQR
jgi:hypothetical protein